MGSTLSGGEYRGLSLFMDLEMNSNEKNSYNFIQFLLTRPEVKFYLFLAIALTFLIKYGSFLETLCVNILTFFTLSFVEYKFFVRRVQKGKVIEMLGYDLTEKREPNLFSAAKEDYEGTKEKIEKFANNDCAGNINTAITVLEDELNRGKQI